MCGVFGVISEVAIESGLLERAQAIQRHRGPDAQNVQRLQVGRWQVGLAHQRLAIIDLSAAGSQPMRSPSGRSLIAYNGEVYNYLELRRELESRGGVFRTRTDTEVIAAACEEYGVADALGRMNGMWAFVWIDLANARIVIARDRFGVKPMYLYERDGMLAFGKIPARRPSSRVSSSSHPGITPSSTVAPRRCARASGATGLSRPWPEPCPPSARRSRRRARCSRMPCGCVCAATSRSACCSPVDSTPRRSRRLPAAVSRLRQI